MLRPRLLLLLSALACAPPRPVEPAAVPQQELAPPSVRATRAFLIASAAEARGDLETAERAWLFLSREDRDRAVSHAYLARFMERQRRWIEAFEAWSEALERDPTLWEAHEALAALSGRVDDPEAERFHLERAVELGGSAAVHERLLGVQRQADDPEAARRTLDRWLTLELADPIDRLHRARAARSLGLHSLAVPDLAAVARGERAADAAPLLWESAEAACRRDTAWTWARGADVTEPVQRRVVVDIAGAVGDAALLERALLGTPDAPLPADHPPWPAPPLGPPAGAAVPEGAAAVRHVAQAWYRARQPERALLVAQAAPDDPWVRVQRARALLALARDAEAKGALRGFPTDHPAAAAALALQLELGVVEPAAVRPRLADPAFAEAFAAAMADALVRGPRPAALRLAAEAGADPTVLVLPAAALRPWLAARDWRQVGDAVESGDRTAASAAARAWTEREPESADAWVALAAAEPERADRHLERALELQPCHAGAIVGLVRGATDAEALGWLDRAREADPLSRVVRRALARRGLEVP